MRVRKLWVGLALFTMAALAGCAGQPAEAPRTAPGGAAVRTAAVERGDLTSTLGYTGDVQARTLVAIVPKVAGQIEQLPVDVGSAVRAGDVLAELDAAALRAQRDQAKAALAGAEARLADVRRGPKAEAIVQAEANARAARARIDALRATARPERVAQARAQLDAARARLAQLEAGATREQVDAARLVSQQARNALFVAQTNRDGICGNKWNPRFVCDSAEAQVNTAQTAIDQAEAQLRVLTAPPTQEARDQAQAAVAAAEQEVRLAETPVTAPELAQAAALAEAAEAQARLVRDPYTPEQVRAAEAQVEQARAALALAEVQLAESKVVAPVTGIVAERYLSRGAVASPAAPVVSLVSREIEVVVHVEEAQLGQVEPGQMAILGVETYPGEAFAARVLSVAPTLDPRSRTAVVKLEPEENPGKLRPGMAVRATLVTARREGALLIPRRALLPSAEPPAVLVVQEGRLVRQAIAVGLTSADRVEVVAGLAEGQSVVIDPAGAREGDTVAIARGG